MPQILVIDDDIDFTEVLCKTLVKKGYGAFPAFNGKDGIELFKELAADLVITDILMPEPNGIEVITALKRIAPEVKIIAISGGGPLISGREYLQSVEIICDIDYTLVKPFKPDYLLRIIREVLTQK